jgi:hypothetical protein
MKRGEDAPLGGKGGRGDLKASFLRLVLSYVEEKQESRFFQAELDPRSIKPAGGGAGMTESNICHCEEHIHFVQCKLRDEAISRDDS